MYLDLNRRKFLSGASAFAGASVLTRLGGSSYAAELPPPADPETGRVVNLSLVAAERPTALPCFGGATLPLWTFSDDWLPIVG